MALELHLSTTTAYHTILIAKSSKDSASHHEPTPMYHICSPHRAAFNFKTTKIARIDRSVAHDAAYHFTSKKSEDIKECTEYGSGVVEMARINWGTLATPPQVILEGQILSLKTTGIMKSDTVFEGPDGLTYTWFLGLHTTLSVEKDGKKIEVAKYHEPFSFTKHPYLTVQPEAMHILDLVVTTWLLVTMRKQNNATAAATTAAVVATV
ncbi:hypothetical protein EIP91_002803 [Steccherinum ochraceum]|uniref:DUF6593 domain-containing protein n=1 Tax=Steccherinum ochraceum TaxID=92696 RepID=A0A4V2MW90_9APHY|nr:hypothetical protein EIP91_002803 [Steccherinum ochraceum]